MKISDLIELLTDTIAQNGDMVIAGMVDGKIYKDIEINCPDSDSPAYLEMYR